MAGVVVCLVPSTPLELEVVAVGVDDHAVEARLAFNTWGTGCKVCSTMTMRADRQGVCTVRWWDMELAMQCHVLLTCVQALTGLMCTQPMKTTNMRYVPLHWHFMVWHEGPSGSTAVVRAADTPDSTSQHLGKCMACVRWLSSWQAGHTGLGQNTSG